MLAFLGTFSFHLTSAPPLPQLLIVLASGFFAFQPSARCGLGVRCMARTGTTVDAATFTTTTGSDAGATTFDLVEILNRSRNLEVARLGSSCGYWNGWIERQQRAENREGMADASVSESSSGMVDFSARKPRIVSRREELEHPTAVEDKRKGKGKEKEKKRGKGTAISAAPRVSL